MMASSEDATIAARLRVRFLGPLALGDVFEAQQDPLLAPPGSWMRRALSSMVRRPSCSKSCSTSKSSSVVALRQDLLQQRAQPGNVPLPVAQLEDDLPTVSAGATRKVR